MMHITGLGDDYHAVKWQWNDTYFRKLATV